MLKDLRRKKQLQILIQLSLDEDFGRGDATTALFPPEVGHWQLTAREPGVFCGREVAQELFSQAQLNIGVIDHLNNGDAFDKGTVIQEYKGDGKLLSVERILLNILQHLSAIASTTDIWVKQINGHRAKIYDTRKTTPGWRYLEKFAVLCGGGQNHRMALDDAIMIKDNHHASQGNPKGDQLQQWITTVVAGSKVPVYVEVENLADCLAVAKAGPQAILLDNMSLKEMSDCVKEVKALVLDNEVELEASGGIRLDTVASVAATGVHRISSGALTQNPPRIDLGLDAL